MQTQLINFTIPKSLLFNIDRFAKKVQKSRSELLREAIRRFLIEEKQRKNDFENIRKCAGRINMNEDKAMAVVDKIRRSLQINQ